MCSFVRSVRRPFLRRGEEGRVEGAQRGNENGYFAPQSERVFAVADCISHPSRCDGFFRLDYAPTHAAPSLAAVSSFVCGKTGTRRFTLVLFPAVRLLERKSPSSHANFGAELDSILGWQFCRRGAMPPWMRLRQPHALQVCACHLNFDHIVACSVCFL